MANPKISVKMNALGMIDKVGVENIKGASCSDLTEGLMKKIRGGDKSKVSVNVIKTCEYDEEQTSTSTKQTQESSVG